MRRAAFAPAPVAAAALALCLAATPAVPLAGAVEPADLALQAADALRAGRLREGRALLEEAVEARPDATAYRVQLAAALLRSGDLRAARREVDLALEIDPADTTARELSGDIHYREGELNLAAGEWEEAAKSPGGRAGSMRSHALEAKIRQARREMNAEQGLDREESRNFLVMYDDRVPRELVRGFFRTLDEAFETLHDELGDSPRDPVTVILYSGAAFRDVTRAPHWVGGLYDGKVRVPVGGLTSVEEAAGLYGVLLHELTHAFLHRMAPEGLPRWFGEGLATRFQGLSPEAARAWLEGHAATAPPTLADLDRALLGVGGDVNAAYAAATLAVAALVDASGFGAVRRVVVAVGAGMPFELALEDDARMTPAELEERWRASLP